MYSAWQSLYLDYKGEAEQYQYKAGQGSGVEEVRETHYSKFRIWKIKRFMKRLSELTDYNLQFLDYMSGRSWGWMDEFGKKPFLYSYLCNYPQQATFKKRLFYLRCIPAEKTLKEKLHMLLIAFSPVYKTTFLDDRRMALHLVMDRRGVKKREFHIFE